MAEAALAVASIEIVPSGKALGADVIGVDIRQDLSADQLRQVRQAWAEHLVLRFRGNGEVPLQRLADFSRLFGDLDRAPVASQKMGQDFAWQHPEITVLSNVLVDGKPVGGLGSYEAVWHSDMTYNATPPKGSALYAVEIPPTGGDTHFANMYRAYETLPGELKERADHLRCVHDASRNSAGSCA
ncbi:TauD/TfdA dioxygenase family protein [Cupriavidus sp. D39]|uniref:TauD/TfdA dioxygenase family protein n=1 Tax=Cupriavidus sp. D39 TaxID=2997877 RepID=UPI002271A55A|nr:TauD/TfdA family dioxygenase [Cupriavidus sp. D39]MCY0855197.1 TauD/TfdA family dioxygenase [Cupriavidus sp. D39]